MTADLPGARPAHLRRPGLVPDITLVGFLRERLAEDEQAARAAMEALAAEGKTEPWQALSATGDDEAARSIAKVRPDIVDIWKGPASRATAEHIARHDPARVLAEVDAKRRIIDLHRDAGWREGNHWCTECGDAGPAGAEGAYWPCSTLRLLALPYAGHADYRAEWAP